MIHEHKDVMFAVYEFMIDDLKLNGLELLLYAMIYHRNDVNKPSILLEDLPSLRLLTGAQERYIVAALNRLWNKKLIYRLPLNEKDRENFGIADTNIEVMYAINLEPLEKLNRRTYAKPTHGTKITYYPLMSFGTTYKY